MIKTAQENNLIKRESLIKIGEASQLLGVSIDTLRRWEKKGWLQAVKTPGGTRLYDKEQLKRLNPNLKRGPKSFLSPIVSIGQISLNSDQPILRTTDSIEAGNFENEDKDKPDFKFNLLTPVLSFILLSSLIVPFYIVSNYLKENQKLSSIKNNPVIQSSEIAQNLANILSPSLSKKFFPPQPPNFLSDKLADSLDPASLPSILGSVLAESSPSASFLEINLDTKINGDASVSGTLTAPNIVYGLTAGENIAITGDPQRPTIASTVSIDTATTTTTGIASFSDSFFTVTTAGAVSIKSGGITTTEILNGTIANGDLASSSITISPGSGLSGGGAVSLGGSVSLASTLGTVVALTSEVEGVLPVANGGSAKALTLAAGGVLWTDSDSFEVSAAGTSGQCLQSAGTSAPTWASCTASAVSGTTNTIAKFTSSSVVGDSSITDDGALVTVTVPGSFSSTLGVTGISTFTGNVNANGGLDVDDVFSVADGGVLTISPSGTGTWLDFDLETEWTAGDLVNADWDSATTQSAALTGINLDFTNLTSVAGSTTYGLLINDLAAQTTSTEYAIYQEGTNWDYGALFEDDVRVGATDFLTISNEGDLTFTDADGAASITGPAGGAFSVVAGAARALTLTGNLGSTWSTSNGLLTVSGDDGLTLTSASTAGIVLNTVDAIANAFDLQQGSDNYINVNTSDGTENIAFGNAVTNPTFSFLGTSAVTIAGSADSTDALVLTAGDITITNGDLDVVAGDFNVTLDAGDTANFAGTAPASVAGNGTSAATNTLAVVGTAGGASSGTTGQTGGTGGALSLTGGIGGAVAGASGIGGVGGTATLAGGAGGNGAATGGAGGGITFTTGNAGTGGNANAGTLSLQVGTITGSGTAAIDIGTTSTAKTINLAGTGATGADTINIGTGGTLADTITIGNNASTSSLAFTSGTGAQTFTSSVVSGTTTSSAFVFNGSAISSGTTLRVTSTSTSGKLVDLNSTNTSGTIFNLAYGASTTLAGDTTGLLVDLNSGTVVATDQNLTGVNFKIPTVTNTITSGTKTLTGMLVNFGSGAGINQTGAGGTLEFIAGDFQLPALTQTAGTLNAYGLKVTTPSSITTGGTAYGAKIVATGVGAGTLYGISVDNIIGAGGTEYAYNVAGTGWDAVLRVGSTTVINGSGVTQVVGGGTGLATVTQNGVLYGNATSNVGVTAEGATGQILIGTTGSAPSWGTISGASCTNCLINNPTADQSIAPSGQGTTGLTVRQTSTGSPTDDIFQITSSDGVTKYFYVDKDGNVSTGAISNTTLTLTPTTNTTALTLVGTNVTSAKNQYINTKNSSGTIFDLSYGAAQTLAGNIIAHNIDLSANVTATNQSASGYVITLPAATNTSGTQNYIGLTITGGALNENGGTATNFYGADITIPALTQTSGTLTAYGIQIDTPSSITTGGTAYGLQVNAVGVGAGTLIGLDIDPITAGAGTETGLQIGSGWDTNLLFNDTTTRVVVADGGTITILDSAGNSLCTITDNSTVGDLSCSGTIGGSGTVGFWSRVSTTLNPSNANDIVSIPTTNTTGADLAVTNTGIYTGTGIVNLTANSATSGDILTVSATAATSGSLITLTGPSAGTAGVTDAALKITSDVGNIGTSNGLISSTATIDSTANAISGVNLYLSTASSQALATTVGQTYYGLYNTLAKTGADTTSGTITSYGTYSTATNTGGDTAGTRNTYGGYFDATGDASGTTKAIGLYATASGADNNYAGIFEAGNVGIGTTAPSAQLQVNATVDARPILTLYDDAVTPLKLFEFTNPTGTMVNGFTFAPTATLSAPSITSQGSDTNIGFTINAKGSGTVDIAGTSTGDVNIAGGSGSTGCTVANSTGNLTCSGTVAGTTPLNSITAATTTATIANANNAIVWNWGTLTTQTGMNFGGGTAMTTGSIFDLGGATYVHTALNDVGEIMNLSFTDASTNANNGGTTIGLNIASTINTTGAGTKSIKGINIATPTKTACTTGACTWTGLAVEDPGTLANATFYAATFAGGNVGIGDITPDALLDIDSTDTDGGDFLITNTGIGTTGSVAAITSNSTTTGDLMTISGTALSTGTALTLTGPTSTGVTDHFIKATADIGSASSLLNLNPDFSGSGVTGYGLYNLATDATANANTDYGYYGSLALTGNAAKVGTGIYSTVTDTSTTGDTLYGVDILTDHNAATASGNKTLYGIRSQLTNDGVTDAAGSHNIYGGYFVATGNTGGTSSTYGIYVDANAGDTSYGIYIDDGAGTTDYGIYQAGSTDDNYFAGQVGVGDLTPDATFEVETGGETRAMFTSTSGSSGIILNSSNANNGILVYDHATSNSFLISWDAGGDDELVLTPTGNLTIDGECDDVSAGTTCADYAEVYLRDVSDPLETGDLLAFNKQTGKVTKAGSANASEIMGIYSTSPGSLIGHRKGIHLGSGSVDLLDPDEVPVALTGRAPLKVSSENGAIGIGDFLTLSSTPGVAMKATQPGPTVGKALENHSGPEIKKIMTFVNVSYADPSNVLANMLLDSNGTLITQQTNADHLTVTSDINAGGVVRASDFMLDASNINMVGAKVSLADVVNSLQSSVLSLQTEQATASAQIAEAKVLSEQAISQTNTLADAVNTTSSSLSSLSSQIQDLLDSLGDEPESTPSGEPDLTPPDTLFASGPARNASHSDAGGSATLANLEVTSEATVSGKLLAYEASIQDTFKSLGQSFLGQTTIAGDFTVDGTFSISQNSINAISTLYLQNNPLSSLVDLFNGSVTINKDGLVSAQALALGGESLGEGIIEAGETEITIPTTLVSQSSRVFLTPTSSLQGSLIAGIIEEGESFKVILSQPNLQDVSFNWLIIQSKQAAN